MSAGQRLIRLLLLHLFQGLLGFIYLLMPCCRNTALCAATPPVGTKGLCTWVEHTFYSSMAFYKGTDYKQSK